MTAQAEITNAINQGYNLGKGEVVSSILTGSTTNARQIGTSCVVGIPTSAVSGRTEREADISTRGKIGDNVHGAFRTGRPAMTNDKPKPVPMDDFAWGQSIERERDVLYRLWWIGPGEHDKEYRVATEEEIAELER